jgi:hypothetical protein
MPKLSKGIWIAKICLLQKKYHKVATKIFPALILQLSGKLTCKKR